ncbi:MAG: TraR/DksA family transcriptional regulator [Planctomycetota bacterium]|nr:MAG: TraR/DksA family transcriptional regulator [Planctomycetota bacterium]
MPKLTKAKLNRYQKVLIQILRELGAKVEHIEESVLRAEGGASPDEAQEFGSENYSAELQINIIQNEEEILREVHAALDRIQQKSYGVCEACDELIPERRLEVLPYARYCVGCQRKVEENGEID